MPNDRPGSSNPPERSTAGAPLAGLQVLSLVDSRLPALGKVLADLGADVEVVEPERSYTDEIRRLIETRGKRFTHLAPQAAREYVADRLTGIDVLVVDPATLRSSGLPSPEALAAERPALVVCVLTDFGLTGPRADWVGSDAVFHALSGSLSRSGQPGRHPLVPPGELFLRSAATQIAWTVVAAAYRATEGRGGAVLDCAVFEAGAVALDPAHGMTGSGTPDIVNAYGRPAASHLYPIYRTADGFVRLCVLAKGQWAAMLQWMGSPPELLDPELELTQVRQEQPERVLPLIEAFVAPMSTETVVSECRARRIPASAVLSPADVLAEPHFRQSGVLTELGEVDGRPIITAEGMARVNGVRTVPRPLPEAVPSLYADRPAGAGPYPLSGVTVLDLGIIVAGSVASALYAELGARVIRVENTGFPDGMRRSFDFATPSLARGHRGKESLGLDLRSASGRQIFLELVARADVVVSNFKPGTLERLGIAYDDLVQVNPRIVCVESTAFGDTGPWRTAMGYGPLVRSGGGHTWLWREDADAAYFADGITIFPDHLVGRVCALSALACLIDRRRTGRGAHVTVAQCDVGLVQLDELLAAESVTPGSAQPPGVPAGRRPLGDVVLPAAGEDQWCIVDAQTAEQLDALGELLGARREDLASALAQWVRARPADEAAQTLQRAGIPAARMIRNAEMADHPALRARELYRSVPVTGTDDVVLVERFPVPPASLPLPVLEPMPMFGTHTRAILTELGKSPQQIDDLFSAGVAQASELVTAGDAPQPAPRAAQPAEAAPR